MNYGKLADFFLTGLLVVFPVLMWTGNYEAGVAAFALLLAAVFCCAMKQPVDEERG